MATYIQTFYYGLQVHITTRQAIENTEDCHPVAVVMCISDLSLRDHQVPSHYCWVHGLSEEGGDKQEVGGLARQEVGMGELIGRYTRRL